MNETPEDLRRLQALLDRSYADAGQHLLSIHTPDRRLDAAGLADRLVGVRVLALATVTADGRPLVGPVDGLFYRGEFWFGSGTESLRFRHLRLRPQVSAAHTVGEILAITVHGNAFEVDLTENRHAGFRALCIETYAPGWEDWGEGAVYARIDADKMFTFLLEESVG